MADWISGRRGKMLPMAKEYMKNAPKTLIWGGSSMPNRMMGKCSKDQSSATLGDFRDE
jgi:hypothetical protein